MINTEKYELTGMGAVWGVQVWPSYDTNTPIGIFFKKLLLLILKMIINLIIILIVILIIYYYSVII